MLLILGAGSFINPAVQLLSNQVFSKGRNMVTDIIHLIYRHKDENSAYL